MFRSTVLVGNPNCGKTSLFNYLTGSNQRIGNWPGVTVEQKKGQVTLASEQLNIIDLPGTYTLTTTHLTTEDERIAANYVWENDNDIIINVVDGDNLERNLYLSTQLLDLNRPMIMIITKYDSLQKTGKSVNAVQLQESLGIPVFCIDSHNKSDIKALKIWLQKQLLNLTPAKPLCVPNKTLEAHIDQLTQELPSASYAEKLAILDDNSAVIDSNASYKEIYDQLDHNMDIDIALAEMRFDTIQTALVQSRTVTTRSKLSISDKIDKFALHRFWGLPIFALVMYLTFTVAINLGAVFIDFFDISAGALFVDLPTQALTNWGAPELLITTIQGVGAGIQTVATFIPVIGFLMVCLTALEDSGYLARAAFVIDRIMRILRLPGRAFVPMLLGFGCNVPAIMASRTLPNQNDRTLVVAMTPFMSCSARLPVYVMVAVSVMGEHAIAAVASMYFIGIAFAAFSGLMIRKTMLPGEHTPLLMELPEYHWPRLSNMLRQSNARLRSFIVDAGKIIVVMVTIISILNSFSFDGTSGHNDTEDSILSQSAKVATTVFEPMGIQQENWPATVGILTGLLAKEAVAGTLNSLYQQMSGEAQDDAGEFNLLDELNSAVDSIGENLAAMTNLIGDPLGIADAANEARANRQADATTANTMTKLFGTSMAAYAFLLFILLYTPCAAALGAIKRELGGWWTGFISFWTFGLAWSTSTLVYQWSNFSNSPVTTIGWTVFIIIAGIITVQYMKRHRKREVIIISSSR